MKPKNKTDVLGVWEVIGFEQRDARGDITYPLGTAISGNLIYTGAGIFSVSVKSAKRPGGSTFSRPTDQEALTQMFLGGIFHTAGDKIIHDVTVCSNFEWIDKLVESLVDTDGEMLTCHIIKVAGAALPCPSKILAVRKRGLRKLGELGPCSV